MGRSERDPNRYGGTEDIIFDDSYTVVGTQERGSVGPTILWGVIAGLGATGLAAVLSFGQFQEGFNSVAKPGVSNETAVIEAGKAEVQEVDLKMDTFQLSASTVKTTGTVVENVPKTDGAEIFGIPIPDGIPVDRVGLTREEKVELNIVIKPGEMTFEFDPNTNELIMDASKTALSTDVSTVTATAKSKDVIGSLISVSRDQLAVFNQGLKGDTTLDLEEIWIVGDSIGAVTDEPVTSQEILEQYADLFIVTQVDKQCTPLITQIPNFEEQFKENIREIAGMQLLNEIDENESFSEDIKALSDLKVSEADEVFENAEVILPEGFKIQNDQGMIDTYNAYKKVMNLEEATANTPTDQMECGVTENTKLILDDDKED